MLTRSGLSISNNALVVRNLVQLLEKKEASLSELESALKTLVGCQFEEGMARLDRILWDWCES